MSNNFRGINESAAEVSLKISFKMKPMNNKF